MLQRPMHRRAFLEKLSILGGVGLTAAIFPTEVGFLTTILNNKNSVRPFYMARGGRVMLDKLTHGVFSEFVGNPFRVQVESGKSVHMELIEAKNLAKGGHTVGGTLEREPFSIVFRAPADVHVEQRIYAMQHEKMGNFDIFLVPIGPDDKGMRYEAVFA